MTPGFLQAKAAELWGHLYVLGSVSVDDFRSSRSAPTQELVTEAILSTCFVGMLDASPVDC